MRRKLLGFSTILLFSSQLILADDRGTKDRKDKKSSGNATYMEANVVEGAPGCGYLLQLLNGRYIRPDHLPKKYRSNYLKVLVKYENAGQLNDTICHADKLVSITEIKRYKSNPNLRASR